MNLSPIESSGPCSKGRTGLPSALQSQKALSSSSFETASTTGLSSTSLSSFSYYNTTTTFHLSNAHFDSSPRKRPGKHKRRGAFVWHSFLDPQRQQQCQPDQQHLVVEEQDEDDRILPRSSLVSSSSLLVSSSTRRSRKYKRRFATCCSCSETIHAAKIVKKLVLNDQKSHRLYSSTATTDVLTVPPKTAVIFDPEGRLIPDHEANSYFVQRLYFCYHDMDPLTPSNIHRDILALSFLEELKSDQMTFYQIIKVTNDISGGGFVELDDKTMARRIRRELGRSTFCPSFLLRDRSPDSSRIQTPPPIKRSKSNI